MLNRKPTYHGESLSLLFCHQIPHLTTTISVLFHTCYPLFSFSFSLPLKLQASSEAEETLKRIQSHRGVTGILIVNKDGVPIKSTLSAEDTVQYAALITQVCLLYFTDLMLSPNFLSLTSFQYSCLGYFILFVLLFFLFFVSARFESKERHSNIGSTKRHNFSASPIKKT